MLKYASCLIYSCLCLIIFPLISQSRESAANQPHKSGDIAQASRHPSASQTFKKNEYFPRRPGVVIYKLKPFISQEQKNKLKNLLAKHSAQTIDRHPRLNLNVIHFPKIFKSEEELCAELIATGVLQFCEPDYLIPPALIPNDDYYSSQWFHPKIGSPAAWDITTGVSEIIAAVCDTGVNAAHPDLQANILLPGYNTVDGSENTSDIFGHGTKVAGCVIAVGNNTIGVAGMCW
ncbi:hypothetical protein KAR34_13135 [bacterium]|nr:hypothetical protein [bacterium]